MDNDVCAGAHTQCNIGDALIIASSPADSEALSLSVRAAEMTGVVCETVDQLCERIRSGACAAIIVEELLTREASRVIADALHEQPGWSDFPMIVISQSGDYGPCWRFLAEAGTGLHAIILERPVRIATLVTALHTARQSRFRQYQVGSELQAREAAEAALRRSEQRLTEFNQSLEEHVQTRTNQLGIALDRLRGLAQELTETEHRERRKLAKMLHDGLQQLLIAIKMQLPGIGGDPERTERIDRIVGEAIAMSRTLAHEMSPPILNDSDLITVIKWIARQFAENHGFTVTDVAQTDSPRIDQNLKIFVFHALRELLLNAVKHSRATGATVTLRDGPAGLFELEVRDDGDGFDVEAIEYAPSPGFGLLSVRERARALGGSLAIDSAPGHGTRLVLTMPRVAAEVPRPVIVPEGSEIKNAAQDPPERQPNRIRIVVADDHDIVREGIVRLLASQADFDVAAEASDGIDAVRKSLTLRPDVVLMDINMPRMDGIEATRQIAELNHAIRIVGLSLTRDKEKIDAMRAAGAVSYVQKDSDVDLLFETIRQACQLPERAHGLVSADPD